MSRNIELKSRLVDLAAAEVAARSLGAELHSVERQHDTYFRVSSGRLKLRQRWIGTREQASELIFYERPNQPAARASDYTLVRIEAGAEMHAMLVAALGVNVEVVKQRTVYLYDHVRIHLDRVQGLGTFLEFEAIVDADCTDAEAAAKVEQLRDVFGVTDASIVSSSYADLLLHARP
jgi:predicted adenylyl cyclase CyaB